MRFATLALLFAGPVLAAVERDPAGYDRVLIPVLSEGIQPGAFGTLWLSELVGKNESPTETQAFTSECAFFCDCVVITCSPQTLSPGTVFNIVPSGVEWNPGHILYVGRSRMGQLPMQLRVRDISRSATSYGTEVPLVWESETTREAIHLLNIPLDSRFRQHLRVYALGRSSELFEARVRIYSFPGDLLLADVPLRLAAVDEPEQSDEFPSQPAYAEILSLASAVSGFDGDAIRLEIIPESPAGQFWAFVAVTNNDTQHVTLVTPQER